jgi:hypothetical protein
MIRTTAEHPFWVKGKGWRQTWEIQPGDMLSSHDGGWTPVEAVTDSKEFITVYNLRVADHHTYFVGCDEWGFSVWAHNADYTAQLLLTGAQARANLRRALNIVPDAANPTAAHHIIPWGLRNWPGVVGDRIRAAARGGFNINGKANGLALPHPHTIEIFDHPLYSRAVAALIGRLPAGLSDTQYANALHAIADLLGSALRRAANNRGGTLRLA